MSDTLRTDAAEFKRDLEGNPWVKSDFARELERELGRVTAERDALAAEVAALKAQSNANNSAPIPLKEWVIEVFLHLCHSPHTPDEWKRDLDEKTKVLLDAIEQRKEVQP
jgi:chorismate mutase